MLADSFEAPSQEIFFRLSGTGTSGWEIGRTQSAITELIKRGVFQGKILDIGCGIGDNALYIAQNTTDTHLTAIDMVPQAIDVARNKAEKSNVHIQFELVNMLEDLSKSNLPAKSFDVVLDSAIFHLFGNDDRLTYIENVRRLIKPGGLYIQLVFSEKETRESEGPRRVKKADILELFSSDNGWTIESIEETLYETRLDSGFGTGASAYLSLIRSNR